MKLSKRIITVIIVSMVIIGVGLVAIGCTGLFPITEAATAEGEQATIEGEQPTGIGGMFSSYGTWIWLTIIIFIPWLVIPMVLSIVYGRRRNLPYYGLWFLLCFFTGWLGYIIEVIYTNTGSRELERSRHIIQEEMLKKSKSKSESPKMPSDANKQSEKTKEPSPKKIKYCMNCGEELPAEAEFCRKCGKKTE